MHDNHKDQHPLPKQEVIKMLKGQKKHIYKEQGSGGPNMKRLVV